MRLTRRLFLLGCASSPALGVGHALAQPRRLLRARIARPRASLTADGDLEVEVQVELWNRNRDPLYVESGCGDAMTAGTRLWVQHLGTVAHAYEHRLMLCSPFVPEPLPLAPGRNRRTIIYATNERSRGHAWRTTGLRVRLDCQYGAVSARSNTLRL